MNYLVYTQAMEPSYPIALLVPMIKKQDIQDAYFTDYGTKPEDVLVLDLHQSVGKKKTPVAEIKQYIEEMLIPTLQDGKIEYILCADTEYFKVLTKQTKAEANLGYVMDCAYGPWKVVYVPNYRQMFYDPDKIKEKISLGMTALESHRNGTHYAPGTSIIAYEDYPETYEEIKKWLDDLLLSNRPLAIDIEGFALRHVESGIGTISFAWSKHEGIAFAVDYCPIPGAKEAPFGVNIRNEPVRKLLKDFFTKSLQKHLYHSISFDVYVLIYQLFMKDILDTEGLLEGLRVMLRDWDCTKLITYLATNSCSGNRLGLKDQSQEFAGNYAMGEDIKDITRIPLPKLLKYNLIDTLSTWYVYEKHYPTLVADNQKEVYEDLFQPAIWDIIQMQLTGMPVNAERVQEVKAILMADQNKSVATILGSPLVQSFVKDVLDVEYAEKMNAQWVKKRITPAEANQEFNPNSDPQKRKLFFDYLKLDVINLTKSKEPSTDGETVEALLNREQDPLVKELLEAFQLYEIVNVLTTNFIPSLEGAVRGPDGWHYLFGSFNLGGTLSGRLSSSGPNLQNLPSTGKGHPIKGKYAKLIKTCFQAPPGWLFCGIDFSSLEDRISALTTKDPNKLKVYTDGYDGHSLRAYAYFGSQMPDIDGSTVEGINAIQKKYKPLRDRSKNPTFTLTYQGTKHALMKKYGFTEEEAIDLERKYHELYQVSDDWVNTQLDRAMDDGYITGAFGLRLRTPLLKQVIRGNSKTPYEAEAEGRTAGNALGQSWCLLNSRAGIEFNGEVRRSRYSLDIRPCAQIHDAQYHLIRDDIEVVSWANKHLVNAVKWQNHPDIWHDEVKLGGEFSIFHPSWAKEITIPNDIQGEEILDIVDKAMQA